MRGQRGAWFVGAAIVALCASSARAARAADFEVTGDTAFQAYEVSDPWGDVVLQRRRFLQTLGLAAYNLQGGEASPGKPDYRVVMRFRLDADFGINEALPSSQSGGETNYATSAGQGVRFVPGLREAPIDLMYGYVEGRNIANGLFGFRVGRQYVTDVLGWWSFDGGLMRLTTPWFVQVEVYGGFEQRGGLPLSTSRFEQNGVWRGNHEGFGGDNQPAYSDYPSYQYAEPAPAFGFAVESNGPSWLHGRFSYRRVYNTGESITQQFPDPAADQSATGGYKTISGTRVSSDRLGYAFDANKNDLGGAKGGIVYDFYSQVFSRAYAGLEGYIGKRVTLGADIDYFYPTFDADSIWNWFTHSPVDTITGRVAVKITRRFDVTASGGARIWLSDGDPSAFGDGQCKALGLGTGCYANTAVDSSNPGLAVVGAYTRDDANRATTSSVDGLANVAARYRFASADVGLRGMLEDGDRGHRVGGDLDAEKKLDGGRFTLGGRTSLYDWDDTLRPDRSATSFAYVLAAAFKPASVANFRVEWEHDMNRLVGQRYRVVGLMNLRVLQ
ncbi:MAG TPA: hypothetical protein VGM56_03170 [Byssovorax sp.]|jgi:hypothetical protein